MKQLLGIYLCISVGGIALGVAQRIVDTQYGQVQGHTLPVNNGEFSTNVDVFYSIPFANTTAGENRFRNPMPPEPWAPGIFVADTIRDACPQSVGGTIDATHPGWDKVGEDCLHINIYTPSDLSGGPYPVMVWLFGGAYTYGANFQYPGHFLATYDVIVATVNYRVNKFGFATTMNSACPGNMGLWDQRMGIQFVVDNIANFGGDPQKITVFGESAGASSTSMQMLSPQSKDLFQQAIMESGSETNVWVITPENLNPENRFYRGAESMGCNRTTDEEMLDCMRALSWEDIHENATDFGAGPVVDGPGGFLPKMPEELREDGNIMKGPIMAGINRDDATPLVEAIVVDVDFCCNRTQFNRIIRNRMVGLLGFMLQNETQEAVAEAMIFNYSPWPHIYNTWLNRDQLGQLITDVAFGHSWNKQITKHQNLAPTYGYVYNYRGRNSTQIVPEWYGVCHIAEIPYVWGHTLLPLNPEVTADSLIEIDAINWTDEDIRHTIFLEKLWTNFAKFGNPTPTPVDNPLGGTTVWPEFTYDETNVLVIGNTSIEAQTRYKQEEYYFWDDYFQYLVDENKTDTMNTGLLSELVLGSMSNWRLTPTVWSGLAGVQHGDDWDEDVFFDYDDY